MDATQVISDSILESDEEENEEETQTKRPAMAKLCILKNPHIPEAELPLFLGDNVLGRDPSTCTLSFPAPSVSKQHATICISVYRRRGCHGDVDMEALVWDLGSMNGTRKGRLKLTPNVRYALSEGDSLVVADIPCQYVSCATDSVSSQDGTTTPGSRNSGAKARLPDALDEKWGDTSTGGKMCVNSGTKSLKRTSVRGSRLAFEQTPPQPQGTLVPESDSDSDSERWGEGDKKQRTLVSDSHKSSPSSSSFLSPANRTVPESDSESPITPSSLNRNGSHRHVSFKTEEPDVDVGRQQVEKKNSPVGNVVEDEERATQGRANPKENEQHVKLKSSISLTREGESLVSTPEVSRKDIPAFNMDSDTDVEGEEEKVVPAGPPNTVLFHMDSDTDVDDDKDISEEVPKSTSSNDIKPSHGATVIQPEDITMDSDTDAGEDDTALSDAATTTKATSFQSAHAADSASSVLLRDFHLDSDTDVDEDAEGNCGAVNKDSKTDEAHTKSDIKVVVPESATAAPDSLHLDSDTDDEVVPAFAIGEPSAAAAVTKSCATANAGVDLDILSDSNTDMEDDSPLATPVAVTSLSVLPGSTSEALKSDSEADTDVDESSVPSAGKKTNPADLRMDSDTDVEGPDSEIGKVADDQMPDLHRENIPGLLVPLLQNCSTPVQASGASAVRPVVLSSCSDSQEDEDFIVAETQSSALPSQHCHTGVDSTKVAALKSCGDKITARSSREDSLRLGLSDSSHLQPSGGTLATESTQAFVSGEGGVNLEDTQAYAAIAAANRTSAENDSNLEATQAYGEDEEPVRNSEMSKKDGCVDLTLEATQAYILESCSNPEYDSDENKTENAAMTETQSFACLTSSTLAMAETQPAPSYGGEESVRSAQQVKPRTQERTEERDTQGKAAHLQEKQIAEAQSVSETQPMCTSNTDESADEDSFPGPRKRSAKQLQLEEEQTQPLTFSQAETQPFHISVEPTQPMVLYGDDESDEEESMLVPRKRKAKQRHFEEEQTQQLSYSEVSTAETQPLASCGDEDSEPMPGPRKRKAKPLQIEDETQSLTNSEVSAVESQPLAVCEGKQSDEDDLTPCLKKRRAKPLQLEEEQTQPLVTSEVSGAQTQPAVTDEDEESDDDSVPGPRKRKAKQLHIEEEETQQLTNSELSVPEGLHVTSREAEDTNLMPSPQKDRTKTLRPEEEQTRPLTTTEVSPVETQPIVRDEESDAENSIPHPQKRKAKQLHLEEEDTQPATNSEVCTFQSTLKRETAGASETTVTDSKEMRERGRQEEEAPECSVAPKRQTRREGKMVPSTRGRGGKAKSDDGSSEVEMKQTRRRKNTRQQEDEDERKSTTNELKEEKLKQEKNELGQEQEETKKARRETEEQEKLQAEDAERMQLELERVEREKREKEEKLRLKKEREEKEKLEREEKEKIERERKEQKEKERLEAAKREEERLEREAKEHQARLEREEREKVEKGGESKGGEKPTVPARGRRAGRRTVAAQGTTEPARDLTSTSDDFPARRTRSRSNSSNSVSSERSALDVNAQESGGKGRGRDAKRGSETPRKTVVRSSRRRTTVAAGQTEHDSNDNSAQELLLTSNSSCSVSSEMSSCSVNTQNRGRGGRQRGRGRKTEPCPDTVAPAINESVQTSAKRGRNSRKAEDSSSEALHENEKEKADSQQAGTSRGQQQANTAGSEHGVSHNEGQSNQGVANEKSPLPKRNGRGRGQKAGKTDPTEDPVVPTVSDGDGDGDGVRNKRKGRKSGLEANEETNSAKVCKGKESAKRTETAEEGGQDEPKEETPDAIQVRKTGRASTVQTKKKAKESLPEQEMGDGEKVEVAAVEKRARGRTSVIQKTKKEVLEESGSPTTSASQDANVEASEPQTPTSSVYRKRQAPPDSSPMAKTPRSCSASPSGSGRLRAGSQAYKVLFTGVVDEAGERVLARLGGAMAKGVSDMNCLVTDKVRRTVKFLCAVAKGIPVVTTDWLEKSGKAGSFLSPNSFIVKDPEQEKKFSFCLQESLRTASGQPLFQGYEIHVTKSVKPEPVHMKDIISSSGATFLPRMPSSHKAQTVVISCEEDWRLCGPAVSASLPVVTAEFILTGILQQKVDFKTHALSPPAADPLPLGGRGRGRRKI